MLRTMIVTAGMMAAGTQVATAVAPLLFNAPLATKVAVDPVALAVGDFDGDGLPDVAVVTTGQDTYKQQNGVSILLNRGKGLFNGAIPYELPSTPLGVAVGDFNGDGLADVAVSSGGTPGLAILLGNGDGTLQAPLYVQSAGGFLATGDFNGDGKLDVALTNSSNNIVVLLGNGDGTFEPGVSYKVGTNPNWIGVGDLDGDGNLDMAVANQGSNDVSILLGDKNGAFHPQRQTFAAGQSPVFVAVSDLNGDGLLDLAVADSSSGEVAILAGKGNGRFGAPVTYAAATGASCLVIGDFNGDGKPDIAVGTSSSGDVAILLGRAGGGFHAATTIPVPSYTPGIVMADFNLDGYADLAVVQPGSNTVVPLLGGGNGVFRQPTLYPAGGTEPSGIAVGDFNGDGHLDLAFANYGTGTVTVFTGNGSSGFELAGTYAVGTNPNSVVTADFNGDGVLDLVAINNNAQSGEQDSTVSVLLGRGDGSFDAQVTYPTQYDAYVGAVGDFNGDGKMDLVVGYYDGGEISVLLGNGDGTFQPMKSAATGGVSRAIGVGDFNHDGKLDVVTTGIGLSGLNGNLLSVLLGNGDGTFQPAQHYTPPLGTSIGIAVGDVNADGIPDVVLGGEGYDDDGAVAIMLNNGDGTFQATGTYTTGAGPFAMTIGDWNGDGFVDIAVAASDFGEVSMLIGTGVGTFGPQALNFMVGSSPEWIVAGDFNGDEKLDLAVANEGGNTFTILTNVTP